MKLKTVKQNQSRNPWINFFSNYATQHKEHPISPNKKKNIRGAVMKEAAKLWKSMSESEKSAYKYATTSAPFQFIFRSIWQNLNKFLDVLRGTHQSGAKADFKKIVQSKIDLHKWQNKIIMELDKKC